MSPTTRRAANLCLPTTGSGATHRSCGQPLRLRLTSHPAAGAQDANTDSASLVGGAVAAVAVVVTLDTTGAMRDRDVATVELATVTTSSAVPTLGAVRRIVPDIAGVVWISAGDTQSPTPGIVIDDHGHVLTSASSMATATPTAVECAGEDTQNVRIVGVDRRRNIAVIATDKRNWPTAAVNTVRLAVGERIQLLFHDGNRSTPELLSAEVRRLDTDGGPVISWSGSVGSSAIAVSRGSGGRSARRDRRRRRHRDHRGAEVSPSDHRPQRRDEHDDATMRLRHPPTR